MVTGSVGLCWSSSRMLDRASARKQRPIVLLPLVSPQKANSVLSLLGAAQDNDDSSRSEAALWSR
jgi:hypothetical protein